VGGCKTAERQATPISCMACATGCALDLIDKVSLDVDLRNRALTQADYRCAAAADLTHFHQRTFKSLF
jgi:hypothetical protein